MYYWTFFLIYLINLLIVGPDNGFLVWSMELYFNALTCALVTLCSLFLGQRLAQDYVGAVNLGVYFLIALVGLAFPVLYLVLS